MTEELTKEKLRSILLPFVAGAVKAEVGSEKSRELIEHRLIRPVSILTDTIYLMVQSAIARDRITLLGPILEAIKAAPVGVNINEALLSTSPDTIAELRDREQSGAPSSDDLRSASDV